jgi:hypothetical protein
MFKNRGHDRIQEPNFADRRPAKIETCSLKIVANFSFSNRPILRNKESCGRDIDTYNPRTCRSDTLLHIERTVQMAPPLFAEADSPLLKTFLINRLQTASEADPDVLSDYILALLRHDQSAEEVMQTCITQLADFITNGTPFPATEADLCVDPAAFVTDLFAALTVFPPHR